MRNLILVIWVFGCTFQLFSQNREASPLETKMTQSSSGATYAVVVGISDYQDPSIPDLRFADKDAEAFANYLRSDVGGKMDNDQIHLGLVYTPYKRYSGLAVKNKKVNQRNTINIIAYNNLSRSLRFGNKGNGALNVLHNG